MPLKHMIVPFGLKQKKVNKKKKTDDTMEQRVTLWWGNLFVLVTAIKEQLCSRL